VGWYLNASKAYQKEDGSALEALAFFHIPLQEYDRVVREAPKNVTGEPRSRMGTMCPRSRDRRMKSPASSKSMTLSPCSCLISGNMFETVCAADMDSGAFTAFVETGGVKATFVGHDHVNDYCGSYHGIYLCYQGGVGYSAYGQAGKL
jgi:hypothetical protein